MSALLPPASSATPGGPRHLFLDLEDTVIDSVDGGWHTWKLLDLRRIKRFIRDWQPSALHVFSFAIHNQQELEAFNRIMRSPLEKALERPLELVPRVDEDIIPISISMRSRGMQNLTFLEVSDFWGKEETFRFCCRHWFGKPWQEQRVSTTALLIDDCVITETWQVPALRLSGGTLDLADLP